MKTPQLQTRREFLRTTLLGSALTWTVPSFIHMTMRSLHADTLHRLTAPDTGRDGTILVVLQLAGGNDGLNTVVPWSDDNYYKARPGIAIPRGNVLKLTDDIAFHPSLTGLQQLINQGKLAIVQGVGYPNPNRSHFRSMEIWQTAIDADRTASHGWLGRYFDNQCQGMDASVGIHLGETLPQAFQARHPKGVTVNPRGDNAQRRPQYDMMMDMEYHDDVETPSGRSIDMLGGRVMTQAGEAPIDFLERTALDARVSADKIQSILKNQSGGPAYPNNRLGRDLKTVSQLIAGGMTTRVYYVSQGGYDTHANQAGAHARLLKEMGDAMQAFIGDLENRGHLDRVMVLTFSEFGRRVQENANQGTDHGAAAPVFIAGGKVRGGVFAKMPSLNPKDLSYGDIVHSVDFRSIYATILERHLHAPSRPILGRDFRQLDFIVKS